MASNTGTSTINFGVAPGSNEASISVTGQSTISATSKAEAFIMGDDTSSDHTADDHKYFGVFAALSCSTCSAGTGFTIYARSAEQLTGTWTLRWVWAD